MKKREFTADHRNRISRALTGRVLSQETKKKISNALVGRVFDDDRNKKISSALKGRSLSKQHRKKIAIKNKERGKTMRGKNHPKWKGGITSSDSKQRALFRNTVQKDVLKRDDYTCGMCGDRGVYLHVDHIKSWAMYPDLRFDINNCRTLCTKCHYHITFGRPMEDSVISWGHNLSQIGGM